MTKQTLFDLDRLIVAYGNACWKAGKHDTDDATHEAALGLVGEMDATREELRQFVMLLNDNCVSLARRIE